MVLSKCLAVILERHISLGSKTLLKHIFSINFFPQAAQNGMLQASLYKKTLCFSSSTWTFWNIWFRIIICNLFTQKLHLQLVQIVQMCKKNVYSDVQKAVSVFMALLCLPIGLSHRETDFTYSSKRLVFCETFEGTLVCQIVNYPERSRQMQEYLKRILIPFHASTSKEYFVAL